jgi:hypothetical protein
MVSKRYQEVVRPYRSLLGENIPPEQITRASQIQSIVVANPDVIEKAYKLVEEEGFVPPKGIIINDKIVQRLGAYEVQGIISVAAFAVAEQEVARGKDYKDEQLSEIMIVAMQELYQGNIKIKLRENGLNSIQL